MERAPQRVKPLQSPLEDRGVSVPHELPGPKLELVDDDYEIIDDKAEELTRLKDRAAALAYSLDYRLTQYEKTSSWLGRLQQWVEQRLLKTEASKQEVVTALGWAHQMLDHLSQHGPDASPEQVEEWSKQIEERHEHAKEKFLAPDIARAPIPTDFNDLISEQERPREQGPILSQEVAGARCPKYGEHLNEFLGEYGQDGYLSNPETGTVVQWDGSGSYDNSLEAAEIGCKRIEEILSGLPDTTDEDLIQKYIDERWHEINLIIDEQMAHGRQGAFVVTAFRPLPESGKLVAIKVGDSEIVIESSTHVRDLLTNPRQNNRGTTAVGAIYKHDIASLKPDSARTYRQSSPQIEIINIQPGAEVTVYQTSDGLYANTGQHLLEAVRNKSLNMTGELPSEADDIIITKTTVQFSPAK